MTDMEHDMNKPKVTKCC